MNTTPRTDAAIHDLSRPFTDFARSLERELAELKEKYALLDQTNNQLRVMSDNVIRTSSEEVAALRREIEVLKESRAAAVEQEQKSRVECNRLRGMVKAQSSNILLGDDIQLALDNFSQLAVVARANAMERMVRNILWQATNDGTLLPHEIEEHIRSVAKDYGCA